MSFFNFSEYQPDYYSAMSRRLAGNVIKLEVFFGADRQTIMIRRNQDLVVRDIMEEVQKTFQIPIAEQVIFHKGNNLTDYIDVTLENLGVENNHPIRINRDPELPNRSPRTHRAKQPQLQPQFNQAPQVNQHQLDPQSYLKEIAPGRVPDPTPYQVQLYNQQMKMNQQIPKQDGPQDILKLNVSLGSERECIHIHGKKPVKVYDLKQVLTRTFKIPPEQQCIVFKGHNIHDFMDETPLYSFGLENNSPINVWARAYNNHPDLRLPRGPDQAPTMQVPNGLPEAYHNTPRLNPGPQMQPRWPGQNSKTVKIEIEHGSDRHSVMLYENERPLTVLDLQNEMEKITHVSVKDQRIFFKSQEISQNPFMSLSECELENNSSVKLIGEPSASTKFTNIFNTRPNGQQQNMNPYLLQQQQQTPRNVYPQGNNNQQNPQQTYRNF